MGWGLGQDSRWNRFIGYLVPAYCDHPDCNKTIDRGLSHVCGGEPYGGEHGCGLYFCEGELSYSEALEVPLCDRCHREVEPFTPKPEHHLWIRHIFSDESWLGWIEDNPKEAMYMRIELYKQMRFMGGE